MSYPVQSTSTVGELVADFRSDTVTRPSIGMLCAMTNAPLGDDVFGDDPTVAKLQAVTAERAGKEAGLFFPSGTQSNLAALMSHCGRGDEYIVGQRAHTYRFEGGGAAVLGSIQPQPIENALDGSLPLDLVAAEIKVDDPHFARTRLLTLENTINGQILSAAYVAKAAALARRHALSFHLDGARAWNAAVAQNVSVAEICSDFDSASLCLSKGLGAPVGSVLVGSREFIKRAVRVRKMLGGGMRQAGVLAAAGLYAIEHNVMRLAEDHQRAQQLANGLQKISELTVESVNTNMVFVRVPKAMCGSWQAYLAGHGIKATIAPKTRLVVHLDISSQGIDRMVQAAASFFSPSSS